MLTWMCVAAVIGQAHEPVSAEAAVWRSRLVVQNVEHQSGACEHALVETPVVSVNGKIIRLREPLQPYRHYLKTAQSQLPPQEYAQLVHQIVARDLPRLIDRTVVVQEAERELGAEKLEQFQAKIEWDWQEVVLPNLIRELSQHTTGAVINADHLALLKQNWLQERLAYEFLFSKAPGADVTPQKYVTELRDHADIRTAYPLTDLRSTR